MYDEITYLLFYTATNTLLKLAIECTHLFLPYSQIHYPCAKIQIYTQTHGYDTNELECRFSAKFQTLDFGFFFFLPP